VIISPSAPGSAPDAIISYAGGVLWISCGRRYASATVNERILFEGVRYAMFDGDVISISRGNDVIVRCPALERAA
jgi:ATPase subunit of ABC transporter with duplicated ATPase domains